MKALTLTLRVLATTVALSTALVAVGLTSPADGPLSIAIHPMFLRVEPSPCGGAPVPRVLAVDVDVKLGSMHAHAGWPGFTFTN